MRKYIATLFLLFCVLCTTAHAQGISQKRQQLEQLPPTKAKAFALQFLELKSKINTLRQQGTEEGYAEEIEQMANQLLGLAQDVYETDASVFITALEGNIKIMDDFVVGIGESAYDDEYILGWGSTVFSELAENSYIMSGHRNQVDTHIRQIQAKVLQIEAQAEKAKTALLDEIAALEDEKETLIAQQAGEEDSHQQDLLQEDINRIINQISILGLVEKQFVKFISVKDDFIAATGKHVEALEILLRRVGNNAILFDTMSDALASIKTMADATSVLQGAPSGMSTLASQLENSTQDLLGIIEVLEILLG